MLKGTTLRHEFNGDGGGRSSSLPGEIPESPYRADAEDWIRVFTEPLATPGRLQPTTPRHEGRGRRVEHVGGRLPFWLERLAALDSEPNSLARQSRREYGSRESARTTRIRAEAVRVLASPTRKMDAESVDSNQKLQVQLKEPVARALDRGNL